MLERGVNGADEQRMDLALLTTSLLTTIGIIVTLWVEACRSG